jgi:hypothetical protein
VVDATAPRQSHLRLLDEFRRAFEGREYRHRSSTVGDKIAVHLFEDLMTLGRSPKLVEGIASGRRVANGQNRRQGIKARRGDATFGEIVPGAAAKRESGFSVAMGPVATIEIGCEMKILAKAMIKQIDRVLGDLTKQVGQFRRGRGTPICVGVVGINFASYAIGLEGDREYRTDGKSHRHPIQEAPEAERRIIAEAAPYFDEFLVLKYRATNDRNADPAFPFEWVDYQMTSRDYGAILTRVSIEYEKRF